MDGCVEDALERARVWYAQYEVKRAGEGILARACASSRSHLAAASSLVPVVQAMGHCG